MNATSNVRHPEKLALLVGSNPLPNYLAATVLQPQEIVLLYSPETQEPRDRLETAFKNKGTTVSTVCIKDATDVRKIRDACHSLQVDHLHYSGGTKPMAAHVRAMMGLEEAQASYLDERKGLLRFDDGFDIRLAECELGLTLDLILALHGYRREKASTTVNGGSTESDVFAVQSRVFENPDLARELYDHFRPAGRTKSITQAKEIPWKAADHGIDLTATMIPDSDSSWTKARYAAWEKFLTGGWLEHWTAGVIRSCLGTSTAVEVSVECKRDNPVPTTFEIDVALIRGHRLYVVSCTTEHEKKALCKSKLFEVAMRARQMGGDLARSALVCLLDGSDNESSYVDQLRSDIAGVWDAPNVPYVFGLADLREWAGTVGAANTGSLMEWLDS